MRLSWLCVLAVTPAIGGVALADPVSYTFSVDAANPGISGLNSVTTGSFTFDASPGTTSALTAFSLTLTDYQGTHLLDTFTDGPGDLSSYTSDFTGTATDPVLSSFEFVGPNFELALQSNGTGFFFGPETENVGGVEVTQVGVSSPGTGSTSSAVAPEPSSLLLLATGLVAAAIIQRRPIRS